jgi:hypothetical protein
LAFIEALTRYADMRSARAVDGHAPPWS